MSFRQLVRIFLKRIYIKGYSNISIADSSRIGNYSRLVVAEGDETRNEKSGITLCDHVGIGRNNELTVWYGNQIILKESSSLNDNCKILGDVIIEKYCTFSANIYASSGNHYTTTNPSWLVKDQDAFVLSTEKGRMEHSKKIHFEEDCWVGYGAFIKQGIYVGRGAMIGANTVVTKDVPPYSIQVGSPNKEIKRRLNFKPPAEIIYSKDEHLPYFYRGFSQRRTELESLRNNEVILAEGESIVTLMSASKPDELHIVGKNILYPQLLNLSISLNGSVNWKVNINAQMIDLKLKTTAAVSIEKDLLYDSLGADLKQYYIISINSESDSFKASKYYFGITSVKLI